MHIGIQHLNFLLTYGHATPTTTHTQFDRLFTLIFKPSAMGKFNEARYCGSLCGSTRLTSNLWRIIPIIERASMVANCCPGHTRGPAWNELNLPCDGFSVLIQRPGLYDLASGPQIRSLRPITYELQVTHSPTYTLVPSGSTSSLTHILRLRGRTG